MHCNAPAYAKRMLDLGVDMVTVGSDWRMLTAAANATVSAMREE